MDAADLRLLDVQMNAVNGGSFGVTVAHRASAHQSNAVMLDWLLEQEDRLGLHTPRPYRDFEERVFRHRRDLTRLLQALRSAGKRILGYFAVATRIRVAADKIFVLFDVIRQSGPFLAQLIHIRVGVFDAATKTVRSSWRSADTPAIFSGGAASSMPEQSRAEGTSAAIHARAPRRRGK